MALSSKFTYYSDFVVYPIAIVGLVGANSRHLTLRSGETWLGACLLGFVLWTLLEYVIHRIALHRMPIFSPMHSLHHNAPLRTSQRRRGSASRYGWASSCCRCGGTPASTSRMASRSA